MKRYFIEWKFNGVNIKLAWDPIYDGPIEGYKKSKFYKVTEYEGNLV